MKIERRRLKIVALLKQNKVTKISKGHGVRPLYSDLGVGNKIDEEDTSDNPDHNDGIIVILYFFLR